jgi:hypothetical protein
MEQVGVSSIDEANGLQDAPSDPYNYILKDQIP